MNAELHRRLSEKWNEGDWDAVFAAYDEEIVMEDTLFPDAGVFRGKAEVLGHLEDLRSFGGKWRFDTERLEESGDDVLWVGTTSGQLDDDTPPYSVRSSAIFTYVDGRCTRIRWFATPEEAEAELG